MAKKRMNKTQFVNAVAEKSGLTKKQAKAALDAINAIVPRELGKNGPGEIGEDSKDYESGQVVSTKGSWEAGVDGALPGIVMEAHPKEGDTYRQEYYKGEAEDWASVISLNESASVPWGSYANLLMTNEWAALDNPPVYEHKYYAPGVGLVMTKYVEGGFELKLNEMR